LRSSECGVRSAEQNGKRRVLAQSTQRRRRDRDEEERDSMDAGSVVWHGARPVSFRPVGRRAAGRDGPDFFALVVQSTRERNTRNSRKTASLAEHAEVQGKTRGLEDWNPAETRDEDGDGDERMEDASDSSSSSAIFLLGVADV